MSQQTLGDFDPLWKGAMQKFYIFLMSVPQIRASPEMSKKIDDFFTGKGTFSNQRLPPEKLFRHHLDLHTNKHRGNSTLIMQEVATMWSIDIGAVDKEQREKCLRFVEMFIEMSQEALIAQKVLNGTLNGGPRVAPNHPPGPGASPAAETQPNPTPPQTVETASQSNREPESTTAAEPPRKRLKSAPSPPPVASPSPRPPEPTLGAPPSSPASDPPASSSRSSTDPPSSSASSLPSQSLPVPVQNPAATLGAEYEKRQLEAPIPIKKPRKPRSPNKRTLVNNKLPSSPPLPPARPAATSSQGLAAGPPLPSSDPGRTVHTQVWSYL